MAKYIFVTGGVVSGVGKGIATASLGNLLKARGYAVTVQKFDPYLNVDPGTISPYQHGEVFVTEDGTETDLDLGHYERFTDENLTASSSVTAGKIYHAVLENERNGEYFGKTVQVIPHVTNEIKNRIHKARNADIVITEIGGTVGDIEGLPFIEAMRQVSADVGKDNCMFIHVTLVPYMESSREQKSKPTQHSVKELLSLGIQPDVIICRTRVPMERDIREKIALFCNVRAECIIDSVDVNSIHALPLMLEREGLANVVCERLKIKNNEPNLSEWNRLVDKEKDATRTVNIALVGKYVALRDAYISVAEALNHAGVANDVRVKLHYVDSELVGDSRQCDLSSHFSGMDGIIVPGGFGDRGTAGMVNAIRYARENDMAFFGIGLGMQLATVEYARNVIGLEQADTAEFEPKSPVLLFDFMTEQKGLGKKGDTMRLGAFDFNIVPDSNAYKAYANYAASERHRNRYEFNNVYAGKLCDGNFSISATTPDTHLVEIIELKNHKWFVASMFHPEFKSRLNKPHPLFVQFVKSCIND